MGIHGWYLLIPLAHKGRISPFKTWALEYIPGIWRETWGHRETLLGTIGLGGVTPDIVNYRLGGEPEMWGVPQGGKLEGGKTSPEWII